MNQNVSSIRLASLDILRGFDLFLLVFFQPVFWAFAHQVDSPFIHSILYHFDHEVWEGFRFWDLVMPLFLFMSGASMPFSFSRFMKTGDISALYGKILKRFVILFILGMVVQGNLLGLNPKYIYLYTNTLQAIASGYLIASMVVLHMSFRWQIVATAALLVVYSIPMMLCGDYTPEGNFAEQVDRLVLGRFRDGVYWNEDGSWSFSPHYTYTWIWSSLTFGVTVLLGYFAGKITKDWKADGRKVVSLLGGIGLALVLAGWLWSFDMPVIKRIWTGSMTLLSGGYCFLLLALFYYWIDYKGHTYGLEWLKIYGMNSITAYMLGEVVNFRCIVESVSRGLHQYLGDFYSVWLSFGNYLIVFLILRYMYKRGIFWKI